MPQSLDDLLLDLLEWLAVRPRPYLEVMEAWRTSCPQLAVWEAANERGLVDRRRRAGGTALVSLSAEGRRLLEQRRPQEARLKRA